MADDVSRWLFDIDVYLVGDFVVFLLLLNFNLRLAEDTWRIFYNETGNSNLTNVAILLFLSSALFLYTYMYGTNREYESKIRCQPHR